MKLQNYAQGQWVEGAGKEKSLFDAITGEQIATASSEGLDFAAMMDYARKVGGPTLRKMTFQERGLMLKALAMHLLTLKAKYYEVSAKTGATKVDSWIDIEGGIGNLFANASLRRQFPDEPFYVDGETAPLSKNGTFIGHHIMVPKQGVAIHINAFNFPIWGMLEKIAVNLMAGVPAIVKPATLTSFLTEAMVKDIIDSKILPEGALQLICGSANGILDHVTNQDVVTFTGSASTGKMLKAHPRLLEEAVPFNMEADSLNASILGEDVVPGTEEFDLFIKEVQREMTVKAGQKCTAVRRIIVPEKLVEDVQIALGKRLAQTVIGNPAVEGVRMGSLAGLEQVKEVKEKVAQLSASQKIVFGDVDNFEVTGADKSKGAFLSPILFLNENPFTNTDCHNIEAFGPVSTIMPLLTHGGPGRAGGGEEMGGKRGILHYLQRTAIQGSPTMITKVTNQYQYGAEQKEFDRHVFQKYFEEIQIGETVITRKHTVTDADIVNFANVSGDHFYAHVDATSLEGTIFEKNVAHGYWVLSKAAGLFVDGKKGPVLLNYGLDECRFVKPVYPGMTIGVRFTAKEKISQEKKDETDIKKGIVKFLVDVYDETGETVALATILTMVKFKNQD